MILIPIYCPNCKACVGTVNTLDVKGIDPALLTQSVSEIDWGKQNIRIKGALKNANVSTIGELIQKRDYELLRQPNFHLKSLQSVKDRLAEMGLGLEHNL